MSTTPMPVIASAAKQSSRSLQPPSYRRPGESRGPALQSGWIPAFAGMTNEVRIHSGLPRYARNDGGWLQGMDEMESQSA